MTTWRKIPDSLMFIASENPLKGAIRPVVSRRFIPASGRTPGDAPIIPTTGLLVLEALGGYKRYFGFDDAKITSRLEMIVTRKEWTEDPESCRDEVIRKQWPIVPESETV